MTNACDTVSRHAKLNETRFPYGSVTVNLESGSFHGTVTMPERKVAAAASNEQNDAKYYRTVKQVQLGISPLA